MLSLAFSKNRIQNAHNSDREQVIDLRRFTLSFFTNIALTLIVLDLIFNTQRLDTRRGLVTSSLRLKSEASILLLQLCRGAFATLWAFCTKATSFIWYGFSFLHGELFTEPRLHLPKARFLVTLRRGFHDPSSDAAQPESAFELRHRMKTLSVTLLHTYSKARFHPPDK
jgi:hypothetical protein